MILMRDPKTGELCEPHPAALARLESLYGNTLPIGIICQSKRKELGQLQVFIIHTRMSKVVCTIRRITARFARMGAALQSRKGGA